jgi:hypothetical protein
MRKKTLKTVFTFHTTSDAFETEDILTNAGIEGRLIPIPRQLSAGCGISWSMLPEEYERIPEEVLRLLPEAEQIVQIEL